MFASLRCSGAVWTGRPRLRGTRDDRNVVRVAGRLTGDRLLESIFRHRRVIQTRSQRQIGCRAMSSSGSGKCRWTGKRR